MDDMEKMENLIPESDTPIKEYIPYEPEEEYEGVPDKITDLGNIGSLEELDEKMEDVREQGEEGSGKYLLPIDYTAYTGDDKFKFGGLEYSNYKVSVHAEMWSQISGGTESEPSNADNYLIFTNARVEPDVIP